jgi:uncharacterized protein
MTQGLVNCFLSLLYLSLLTFRDFRIKGLSATSVTNWQPFHYRTRNGAEIDLILEGPFGVLPIQVKYGSTVKLKQISSLIQFVEEHHLPFGIVFNHSRTIEWVHSKIVQIPVGWI